jgi:hypothetical protein
MEKAVAHARASEDRWGVYRREKSLWPGVEEGPAYSDRDLVFGTVTEVGIRREAIVDAYDDEGSERRVVVAAAAAAAGRTLLTVVVCLETSANGRNAEAAVVAAAAFADAVNRCHKWMGLVAENEDFGSVVRHAVHAEIVGVAIEASPREVVVVALQSWTSHARDHRHYR